jgi:hypothetical protein
VNATVSPVWVLLRQPENQRGGSLGDGRSTGPTVRVGPVPGDQVPVPTQQSCRLDKEAPETLAGEQSCESGQDGPIRWLERRSTDLAPEDCYLVAEQDHLDGEVSVAAIDEADQMEEATERPVRGTRGPSPDARRVGVRASKSSSHPMDGILGTDRAAKSCSPVTEPRPARGLLTASSPGSPAALWSKTVLGDQHGRTRSRLFPPSCRSGVPTTAIGIFVPYTSRQLRVAIEVLVPYTSNTASSGQRSRFWWPTAPHQRCERLDKRLQNGELLRIVNECRGDGVRQS